MSIKAKAVETDEEEVIVVFRKEKGGSLIAFFPGIKGDSTPYNYSCYSPRDGHSACSPDYIHQTKAATPEEYAWLKAKLEQNGYKLVVRKKVMQEYLHYNKEKNAK